jgi:FdhD protein
VTERAHGDRSAERLPVTAAVLAGGDNRRMGAVKALLPVEGTTLVAHVASLVAGVCEHTTVVTGSPDDLADAGLTEDVEVVSDEVPGGGPLGAIVTALGAARDDWVLVVAADMPSIRPDLVRLLWDERTGVDAVVPFTSKGAEPLFALYSTRCLEAARAALDAGHRRPLAVLDEVRAARVGEERLREADPELESFANVNEPEDLGGTPAGAGRPLPVERPVTISMNDTEVATVQSSPRDLDELAVGFLLAEGLLTDRDALRGVEVDEETGVVEVVSDEGVPDDMFFRTRHFTSGCGKGFTFVTVGHARGLTPLDSDAPFSTEELSGLVRAMSGAAAEYRRTGGVHSCALGRDGELVLAREDIGRHNALDKVLGRAWLDRIPTRDGILATTGRISYEMAVKAAKAKVPVVVSKTAATDLAAEIAESLGITLVGYARGRGMQVYTHPGRVETPDGGGTTAPGAETDESGGREETT